jgi:hypothetical protein
MNNTSVLKENLILMKKRDYCYKYSLFNIVFTYQRTQIFSNHKAIYGEQLYL